MARIHVHGVCSKLRDKRCSRGNPLFQRPGEARTTLNPFPEFRRPLGRRLFRIYSERSSLRNCTLSHKHEESWQKASRVGFPSISFRLLTFARVVQTTSSRRVVSTRSIASSIAPHRWTLLGGTRGKATRHQRVLCAEQSARLFPLRRDEWSVRRDGENRTGPRVKVINYFSNVFASQSVTRLTFRFYVKPRP